MHLSKMRQTVLKPASQTRGALRMLQMLTLLAPAILATPVLSEENAASNAAPLATARAAVKGLGETLEEFVRKIDAGADPATLEHAETITQGDERAFRYMKAIPTAAEPCLTCHGSSLEPALKVEILRLYPDDQATGFKAGELRGAFTVTQKLK